MENSLSRAPSDQALPAAPKPGVSGAAHEPPGLPRRRRSLGRALRPALRPTVRVLVFPWFIWYVVGLGPGQLRRRVFHRSRLGRGASWLLQIALYVLVGLPLTLFVTGEVLITLNELFIAEQAEYRLQSDYAMGLADKPLLVPGPHTPPVPAVPPGPTEEYRQYLVEVYSPVILQKVSSHPEWDVPLLIDFDGNENPRDNVRTEPRFRPHVAGVYGELTAETADSYYLTYSLYHVKDYDHPIREMLSDWTYHDNDNEGFHIRVDKSTMQVVEAETWFHNRFLLFNHTGKSHGTEPVHGKLHLEDGTHLVLLAQQQGHGVRCAQHVDLETLKRNAKVLRFRGGRKPVPVATDDSVQLDGTYELANFDRWYLQARGPFGKNGQGTAMFEEMIVLGRYPSGLPIVIGRFIGGKDYAKGSWSRPKPMWSWDDGWDDIPIFVWHFYPSLSFESHGGSAVSHEYLYNRPVSKTFTESPSELFDLLKLDVVRREGQKWSDLEKHGEMNRHMYWEALKVELRQYVNYLFHALG